MNSSPIVFAPDTRLEVRYSTNELADRLRPFVLDLANRLVRGGSLGDSVAATASLMPDLAAYFVVDRDAEESFSLRKEYLFAIGTFNRSSSSASEIARVTALTLRAPPSS